LFKTLKSLASGSIAICSLGRSRKLHAETTKNSNTSSRVLQPAKILDCAGIIRIHSAR